MRDPERNNADFIRHNTVIDHAPLVPEIALHLASEITPIWQASEDHLHSLGIEPPFWAFAWPGSQLIARYILDTPQAVKGRHILDVACGCGLAAIAAALSGASRIDANDVDPLALEATTLNARLNDAALTTLPGDLIGSTPECDLMVVGDVCYNDSMASRMIPWLLACSRHCEVWLCDPGRHYAPRMPLEILSKRDVIVTQELESSDQRTTTLFRLRDISAPR